MIVNDIDRHSCVYICIYGIIFHFFLIPDQISSDLLFSTTNSTQSSDINEATLLMSSQTSLPFTVPIGAFAVPSSSQALLSVLSTKSTNPLGNTNNNLNQNHNNNNKSHTQNMKNQKIMILKPTTSVMNSTLKVGKTNAPMLNYIYDAHVSSNKYHHHDHRLVNLLYNVYILELVIIFS